MQVLGLMEVMETDLVACSKSSKQAYTRKNDAERVKVMFEGESGRHLCEKARI